MYFTGNCRVRVLNSVKPYKDTGRTTRNLVAQVVHRFFCMKSHRLPNPRQYRCVCAYIRTIATDKNLYKATVFFFFFFFSCFFTPPPSSLRRFSIASLFFFSSRTPTRRPHHAAYILRCRRGPRTLFIEYPRGCVVRE